MPVIKTRRGKVDFAELRAMRKRYARYVRPHRRSLVAALMASLAAVAMTVVAPWPIKLIFDVVLSDAMAKSAVGRWFVRYAPDAGAALLVICVSIVLIAALEAGFAYLRDVILARTGQEIVGKIRQDLFRHMQRLSPDVFETRRSGDLLLRLTGDVQMLRLMLVSAAVTAGENAVTIVATLAIMLWINPMLGAISAAVIPLVAWSAVRISRKIKVAVKSQREKESHVASIAHEVLGAMSVVQAFNRERIEQRRFARENRSTVRAGLRTTRLEARLLRIVSLATAIAICAVLYVGVRQVLAGRMTSGDLLVFVAYVRAVNRPLRKLSSLAGQLAKAGSCVRRISDILAIPPAVCDRPHAVVAAGLSGRIEFNRVGFVYPNGTRALKGLTLGIDHGERIAIVGASGAGKSTLMKLLLRFYDVTEGGIELDGRDIRDYTLASLRDQFAVVQQDTVLFGLTIAENIGLGCDTLDSAAIERAARQVGAEQFIEALPHGYNTVLSERGTTLSGGQRQRIALARAVLRSTPILILDEPITGLDAPSAIVAEATYMGAGRARTTLVIRHELCSMESFDRIIVLDRGRVVAVGTHGSLLRDCDQYESLYHAWSARAGGAPLEEPRDAHSSERLAC